MTLKFMYIVIAIILMVGVWLIYSKTQRGNTLGGSLKVTEAFTNPKEAALATAAAGGEVEKVKQLAKEGANVNAVGQNGELNILAWAMVNKSKTGMVALLELGADPNIVLESEFTPMHLAASAEDIYYLKILIEHGGNPNWKNADGEPLLLLAIRQRRLGHIEYLLGKGADINVVDSLGYSMVMKAVAVGEWGVALLFLEKGIDIRIVAKNGHTLTELVQDSINNPVVAKTSDANFLNVKDFLEKKGVKFKE